MVAERHQWVLRQVAGYRTGRAAGTIHSEVSQNPRDVMDRDSWAVLDDARDENGELEIQDAAGKKEVDGASSVPDL